MTRARPLLFLLGLLLLGGFPGPVRAQEPPPRPGTPPRFERLSLEHGLSQVTIHCMLQDSRGYLWFGTEDGLNQYDGYTFTIYRRDPADPTSLSANTIRALAEDASGNLWVGTDSGGLNRFDRATARFTQFRHNPANPNSPSPGPITALYAAPTGLLWLGTESSGLDRFDPATSTFTHYRHDAQNPNSLSHDAVTALTADPTGGLWIATRGGGLNRFDPATGNFTAYRAAPTPSAPTPSQRLRSDYVTALFPRPNGHLWVGTFRGVSELDPATGMFTPYPTSPDASLHEEVVNALYEDSSGNLWLAMASGLYEMPPLWDPPQTPTQAQWIPYVHDPEDPTSLSEDVVTTLWEDTSGILWLGTMHTGLNKLDFKTRRFAHYHHLPAVPTSLHSNTVNALYEDATGVLWLGTSGVTGGLERLTTRPGPFDFFPAQPAAPANLPNYAVYALLETRTGEFWVGTYGGGLLQFNRQTQQVQKTYQFAPETPVDWDANTIWVMCEDAAGWLWLGTGAGLIHFDPRTAHFTRYQHDPATPTSLSGDFVLSLYQDQAGHLWVGTTTGLDQFDPHTQTFRHYRNDPADLRSLSSNAVAALYEDQAHVLWVGTDDGLNRFDPATDTFTPYTDKDGLPNDAIGCILEDAMGHLWLSTGQGLARFTPRTGQFKNYDVRDGLQSDEFNRGACYKNQRGEMFFGGVNGFNVFDPAQLTDNPHLPPVVLTAFSLFNKPVSVGGDSPLTQVIGETPALRLPYWDYVFAFEFAALDYTLPSKNQYAYQLVGYDRDWNYVDSSRRYASYANLPPGTYTFRVKASNNDGVWNETGVTLPVTILPPPWKTWWAYTLYALLAFFSVAAYVRGHTRELERRHLAHTMSAVQHERDRIAALLESRRQLLASISHDLRTPVAIVRGQLEWMLAEPSASPLQQKLTGMTQELDRLQALLEDLFTLSRLEVDRLTLNPVPLDVVQVARRAVESLSALAWQQGKVEVTLETTEPSLGLVADEQRLLQALMNLLRNAVRHTLPGGLVILRVYQTDGNVVLEVQDTGEGILPSDLPHIWERFYRGQSQAGGGSGLGLALVKEMTEAMGGRVAVESVLGEGSCFTLTFPGLTRD